MSPKSIQMTAAQLRGCRVLVNTCAALEPVDSVLVISDERTVRIGGWIAVCASEVGASVIHQTVPMQGLPGEEPPEEVRKLMCESDVIFGITTLSLAHTQARFEASERGVRYLSLPFYNEEVLVRPALQADFRGLTSLSRSLADRLTNGMAATLTTPAGTTLSLSLEGRRANAAPGWCFAHGSIAPPPDAEANIAPVEHATNGTIVVDGSVPCDGLGKLDSPLILDVTDGVVQSIEGVGAATVLQLLARVARPEARVVAELGIGLNPLAELCGSMLEDEGCSGTIHLGVGSNATIGGKNDVAFHLDFIICKPTLIVDGDILVKDGVIADL